MYLYELIKNKYGASGNDAFNKQKQLYEALGSPYGAYKGSSQQNTFLMQNQEKWDATQQAQPQAQTATATGGNQNQSLAQQYAQSVLPPGGLKTQQQFTQMYPETSFINYPAFREWALSQANPEINRLKDQGMNQQLVQQNQQGALRFGQAGVDQQNLSNAYERQRQDLAQSYYDPLVNQYSNLYNQLYSQYVQDPNAFEFTPVNMSQVMGSQYNPTTPTAQTSQTAGNPMTVPSPTTQTSPVSQYSQATQRSGSSQNLMNMYDRLMKQFNGNQINQGTFHTLKNQYI